MIFFATGLLSRYAASSNSCGQTKKESTCAKQPCPSPFLAIASPLSGATVGTTFAVSGRGCGLFEGNVVIRVLDSRGVQVGQAVTTLGGASVGAGGQGTYNVAMSIAGAQGSTLSLLALSNNVEYSRVTVNFTGGAVPGQCVSAAVSILEPLEGASVPVSFPIRGDAALIDHGAQH